MASQTSVSDAKSNGRGEGVVGSIAGFGDDVSSLIELQAKLLAIDTRETASRAVVPLGFTVFGLATCLGCVPVAVAGVGLLLARAFAIAPAWGLLLAAAVVLLGAAALTIVAGLRLARSFDSLERSRDELVRNLSWIRTVLVHSGRPAPKRQF
jgi:hypothetical protein